jgi:hypothetical protein
MAVWRYKVVAVDDENRHHLIIGLNRDNVDSLLDGDVFTLQHGIAITLTENSDIVLMFAETDDDLAKRFPPSLRPVRLIPPLLTCISRPRYSGGEQMANKPRLHTGEALYRGAVVGDPPQLRFAEHAEPPNCLYGGAGTVSVRARRPATKGGTHPNACAGVAAVAEG